MMIKVDIKTNRIRSNILRLKRSFKSVASDAVKTSAEETVKPYSLQICPVDTGALRASWRMIETETGPRFYTWEMRYGNEDAYYAAMQHETIPKKRTPGTQWQYLRVPMMERATEFFQQLAAHLRKAL